jgi:CRISPR/Cas system-associated endonuclease Cas1
MGFRTVVIKNRAKLEFRLNSLIIRGEQEKKVFIDEINTLIIQNTAVSLTASLLCELMKRNIKVRKINFQG